MGVSLSFSCVVEYCCCCLLNRVGLQRDSMGLVEKARSAFREYLDLFAENGERKDSSADVAVPGARAEAVALEFRHSCANLEKALSVSRADDGTFDVSFTYFQI